MGWSGEILQACTSNRFLRRWRLSLAVLVVCVGALGLSGCIADPPPKIGTATAGDNRAVVSWQPPLGDTALTVTGYVVTPWIGFVAQTPAVFTSTETTQIVGGLTNGVTYTFTVRTIQDSAESGMSNPVVPGPKLAAAYAFTCGVVSGGAVRCWGENDFGQLGNGTTTDSTTPVSVTGLTGASAVTAGRNHACALVGGTVKCWGAGVSGELGDGTNANSFTPVAVVGIADATAISAGEGHTCALVTGGAMKCWGGNGAGQLGNGTTTNASTPVTVTGITGAIAMDANFDHSCAVVASGVAKCWGLNENGQLGNGTTTFDPTPLPVTVIGLSGATAVTAGMGHTCARVPGGSVKCWGANESGELGDGTTTTDLDVVTVSGLTGARVLAAGWQHTCVLVEGGAMKCWGYDGFGGLGNGDAGGGLTPVSVTGLSNAIAITSGGFFSCAALIDGTVKCWGDNEFGQLGDGTKIPKSSPVAVVGL